MSFICWLFCSFHLKSTKKKIKKIRKLKLSINQDYDAPISQITNTIIRSVVFPLVFKCSQINTKVSKIKEQLPLRLNSALLKVWLTYLSYLYWSKVKVSALQIL